MSAHRAENKHRERKKERERDNEQKKKQDNKNSFDYHFDSSKQTILFLFDWFSVGNYAFPIRLYSFIIWIPQIKCDLKIWQKIGEFKITTSRSD